MPNDVRYNTQCHAGAGPEERIRNRLKNSGGPDRAGTVVKVGDGPTRTFHNIHQQGQQQFNVRPRDKS